MCLLVWARTWVFRWLRNQRRVLDLLSWGYKQSWATTTWRLGREFRSSLRASLTIEPSLQTAPPPQLSYFIKVWGGQGDLEERREGKLWSGCSLWEKNKEKEKEIKSRLLKWLSEKKACAWTPRSDPLNPHGRRKELTPSCKLSLDCHTYNGLQAHACTQRNKQSKNELETDPRLKQM